jgi:translation elongation factor EF-Tu-like GTPase
MTGHAAVGAAIEVRNVIAITGRGAVLIGYVRGGTPRIGQLTAVLDLGRSGERRLEVIAVERLSSMEAGGGAIGLVFRNPPSVAELRLALPAGALLTLDESAIDR